MTRSIWRIIYTRFSALANFGTDGCGLRPAAEFEHEVLDRLVSASRAGPVKFGVEGRRCHLDGGHCAFFFALDAVLTGACLDGPKKNLSQTCGEVRFVAADGP